MEALTRIRLSQILFSPYEADHLFRSSYFLITTLFHWKKFQHQLSNAVHESVLLALEKTGLPIRITLRNDTRFSGDWSFGRPRSSSSVQRRIKDSHQACHTKSPGDSHFFLCLSRPFLSHHTVCSKVYDVDDNVATMGKQALQSDLWSALKHSSQTVLFQQLVFFSLEQKVT